MSYLRKRKKSDDTPELDITPFMNLMIVLVPVLLLSLVFTHTAVINLNFPSGQALADLDPAAVHLEVRVTEEQLVVADGRSIIKTLPRLASGEHDYQALSQVMQELKARLPEKQDATVLLQPGTPYQTLVSILDKVRSVVILLPDQSVAQAALFPEINLGDAP